jgi:hypothetical protein
MIVFFVFFGAPIDALAEGDEYSIHAVSYGTIQGMQRSFFVDGENSSEPLDIPLVIWVIKNQHKVILFDAGYYRESWTQQWISYRPTRRWKQRV